MLSVIPNGMFENTLIYAVLDWTIATIQILVYNALNLSFIQMRKHSTRELK